MTPKFKIFDRNKVTPVATDSSEAQQLFDYLVWLTTGDNRDKVIRYFESVVGIDAVRVSQDGLEYNAKTRELSFNVFTLSDTGMKIRDAEGEALKTPTTVTVDFPPPWL